MDFRSWITSGLTRNYPASRPKAATGFTVEAALNEQFSFQVAMRTAEGLKVRVSSDGPKGWRIRIRRVGYVPIPHHNSPIEKSSLDIEGRGHIPGYVPDPLFDEDTIELPPFETHAFWITVRPGRGADPGRYPVKVSVIPERGSGKTHTVWVRLYDVVISKRRGFPIAHWFYVDSLIDWYGTDLFDRRFWEILPPYAKDVADHGVDTIYVPVFTPPLDGVKRPSQLLRVRKSGREKYRFDWRDVKRYIDTTKRCGIRNFEWCHPFTQWGSRNAIRIYEGQGRDEKLLWRPSTSATSGTYRNFLSQYLPKLYRFLSEENILNRSFFHVSDEPHGEEHIGNYRKARKVLKELAPWMKVMDALSDIEYARQKLTDMPIAIIRTALDFVNEGIPCWCYYCLGPRGKYLNRLFDTPLPKIAMHGFLFYRWPLQGFLHWSYNYWYQGRTRNLIDPYTVLEGRRWPEWALGDAFMVYPGQMGPVDSIRWEVFGESLQDYALLQTMGVERSSSIFDPIRSFSSFPKTEAWRRDAKRSVISGKA